MRDTAFYPFTATTLLESTQRCGIVDLSSQAPEKAIKAHVAGALAAGATLHEHEAVVSWQPTRDGGVRVETELGVYTARRLVLAAGAWLPQLVPALQVIQASRSSAVVYTADAVISLSRGVSQWAQSTVRGVDCAAHC